MTSWFPSIPYPPAGEGIWSPVTSTLNWCEEDYYATQYAAEIVNAFTNVIFMLLAIKGIRNCLQNNHDRIFLITFFGYLVVGTGSFLFHSTLKYPMQLVDELSMIYTTCFMVYATFSYGKSQRFSLLLAMFLFALAIFITLYYHYLQDPVFHQNMYALLTAIVLLRSIWVMEISLRPSRRHKGQKTSTKAANGALHVESAEERRKDERDMEILGIMWNMVAYGLTIFLGGFAIWNLDNVFCSTIRKWRREVGLPWGILLEGHGWWHLMTGIGAYFYIMWGIWLRHCLNGKQDQYKLIWPRLITSFPVIELRTDPMGSSRGNAKKSQ